MSLDSEIERYRTMLLNATGLIDDNAIADFVRQAFSAADPQFFTSAMSSSGKYHPTEDNGRGGCARHCLKVGRIAHDLSSFYEITKQERDIVTAAGLLHDICKNGNPWTDKTQYEHGLIAYDYLGEFTLAEPYKELIRSAVRYHLGKWAMPESEKPRAENPTRTELVVQLADFIGSRKSISFLPGLELSQDAIQSYK